VQRPHSACGSCLPVRPRAGRAKGAAAFTEYVAAQLRPELEGAQVEVKGPLTLVAAGGLQFNLDRVFAYCSNNPDGCKSEIATYVKGVAQVYNGRVPASSKDAVRIIVRTRAYLRASSPQWMEMNWRALVGELVMLPAMDAPQTIRVIEEKNNAELGLSADEVFNLGLANLRAHLKPLMQIAKVVQPGQIGHFGGDVYHSSRLALHESWSPLATAQDGKLIVAAPGTDLAEDTPVAIDALRTLTQNVMSRMPRPLSSELLRWTPQRWEVVR
jgi:uncharacterized protein YtpQ (UPF0354 family)